MGRWAKGEKPALEESPTQKARSSWPYPRQTEGPSHTGWTARIGLSERTLATKTLRRRVLALGDGLPAPPVASHCISPSAGLGESSSLAP